MFRNDEKGSALAHLGELPSEKASIATLATNCVLMGHENRADYVWSREEFLTLCEHMLNGNPLTDFLHVYRDASGNPRFSRSKTARADRRATWAWETITGKAKSKVGIGFYPTNTSGESRWGAMDFDAHDGNAQRARNLALAAFTLLYRHPQLYVVLGTSGSEGWHLFAFTREFYPVSDWTRLLRQVASTVGTEVCAGLCEIFPNDPEPGSLGYGIRAPGTWNPKHDTVGSITFQSVTPLLKEERKRRKECPFLYHATDRGAEMRLHDKEPFYRGAGGSWQSQFMITLPGTRHERLKALVLNAFYQVGHEVLRWNAEAQYNEAITPPKATQSEHLQEFEELWHWISEQWNAELCEAELQILGSLSTETERDAFRIAWSFARKAQVDGTSDFPFPVENIAARVGLTHQAVSKLRVRFVQLHLLEKTAEHIANRKAARFRWLPNLTQ